MVKTTDQVSIPDLSVTGDPFYLKIRSNLSWFILWCYDNIFRLCSSQFAKLSRPRDSEVTIVVFESSCHLLLPKGRGNPVKCLDQSSHYHFLMLNVKQESCEYQVLKIY